MLFAFKVGPEDGSVEDARSQIETLNFVTGGLSAQLSKESGGDLSLEEFASLFCHSPTVSKLSVACKE